MQEVFPTLRAFWFLEKTTLHKNYISGAILKIQLTRNLPTNVQVHKCWWEPRNAGTRCTSNYSQLEKELHPIAGLTA